MMQKQQGQTGKQQKALRSVKKENGGKTTVESKVGSHGTTTSVETRACATAEKVLSDTMAAKEVTHQRNSRRRRNHDQHSHSFLARGGDEAEVFSCAESSPGGDVHPKDSNNLFVSSELNDSVCPIPNLSSDRNFYGCNSLSGDVMSPFEHGQSTNLSLLVPRWRSHSTLERCCSRAHNLPTTGEEIKERGTSISSGNDRCTSGDDKEISNEGHPLIFMHKEHLRGLVAHNNPKNQKTKLGHRVRVSNHLDPEVVEAPARGIDQSRSGNVKDDDRLNGCADDVGVAAIERQFSNASIEDLERTSPARFEWPNVRGEKDGGEPEEEVVGGRGGTELGLEPVLGDHEAADSPSSVPSFQDEQVHGGATHLMIEKDRLLSQGGISCLSSSPNTLSRHQEQSYSFTPEVNSALCSLVEEHVVNSLSQHVERMMQHRRSQLRRIAEYLTEAINRVAWSKGVKYDDIRYYVFGSVAMCTVLPDGDNDMTIEIGGLLNPIKVPGKGKTTFGYHDPASSDSNGANECSGVSLSQATSIAGGELLSDVAEFFRQQNASVYVDALVLAEVRVLKLVMDGCSYDITMNQLGGVDCVRFLHEMDMAIGSQHLLKRTLLLLKAWCCYEAHVLSGQGGYISSYAATIMLIAMMNTVEFLEDVEESERWGEGSENKKGEEENKNKNNPGDDADCGDSWKSKENIIKEVSPLQLFARFLKFFSYFDFEHYCVTVFGPLPCASINGTSLDLSRLEVPAARKENHVDSPKSSSFSQTEDRVEELVDVNFLGLTPEGQAALGHCIRRRLKPLVTVSGVKHMLWEGCVHRRHGHTGSHPSECTAGEVNLSDKMCDNTADILGELRIDRPGSAEEDAQLSCATCDTVNYPLRTMNVMDPLRWSASVCRGVCRNHLQRIRRAFREGLALFEMGSAKLNDASTSSSSLVCSERSDGASGSAVASVTQLVNDVDFSNRSGMKSKRFDSIKWSILKDLFGKTLEVLQKNSPEPMLLSPYPKLTKCPQCKEPSFFCVPDAQQVCDAQFVFKGHSETSNRRDDPSGWQSREDGSAGETHNACLGNGGFQQQQQQQQSMGPLVYPVHMAPLSVPSTPPASASGSATAANTAGVSATASSNTTATAAHPSSSQHINFPQGGGWSRSGNQPNGDSSGSSLVMRHHLTRGRPLLRTGIKGLGGSKNHRLTNTTFGSSGNLLYSTESLPFLCNSGFAGTLTSTAGCSTPMKCVGMEGTSMGFAVPPPPPPPSSSSSSPSLSPSALAAITAATSSSSLSAGTHVQALVASQRHQGLWKYTPVPVIPTDEIKSKMGNVNTMATGSTMAVQKKPMMYAFGY